MLKIMIDPPNGWRYGFPREYINESNLSIEDWLVANGYPAEDAAFASDWLRFWEVEDTDNGNNT